MTLFDYLVIAALLASLVIGFWRGVVAEILTLAAWVMGFLAAKHLGGWVSEHFLQTFFADPTLLAIAGWVATFVAILIVFAILRVMLRGMLRAIGLGMLDRLLGLVFGVLRGSLIVLVGVGVAGMTPLPSKDWWQDALLSPYCEKAVLLASPWLPAEINSRIRFH